MVGKAIYAKVNQTHVKLTTFCKLGVGLKKTDYQRTRVVTSSSRLFLFDGAQLSLSFP